MANIFTIPAGHSVAHVAAKHVLDVVPAESLSQAVLLVPTRRACMVMRHAFGQLLGDRAALLPRIFSIADLDAESITLLKEKAFAMLESIPPAMSAYEQRYLLGVATKAFEEQRIGAPTTLNNALALADELMTLQDDCARAGVQLSHENLRPLLYADFATHWEQSLQFLGILSDTWPAIEEEVGLTIAPAREARLLTALAEMYQSSPADYQLFVIGSTASHEATAAFMRSVANMPSGCVMLPGVDATMSEAEWSGIAVGHPLFHLKQFLDAFEITPATIASLAPANRSIWLDALSGTETIAEWKTQTLAPHEHIKLISCAHPEEETRVITLLLRETLETSGKRVALITPDEGLMDRVAAQMKRYGVLVDTLNAGTLASTETGSLWLALAACVADPSRMLLLRHLLQHPLMNIDTTFLRLMEPYWHGVPTQRFGQLPRMPEQVRNHPTALLLQPLLRDMAKLSRASLTASAWVTQLITLMAPFTPLTGAAHEAVEEALETLAGADRFGPIVIHEFVPLLQHALQENWRNAGLNTHPHIFMLTPAEARLQQFDRVIIANMQDDLWPGSHQPSAWLNMAAKTALGLPLPAERTSLMAHDMLMLASSGEVFITYPRRDGGSPTMRSRFIERLVTLLAAHGIDETSITAQHYSDWANALDAAENFQPEEAVKPTPIAAQRPTTLPVSALELLFSDPFNLYARHVLGLKVLNDIDAELEPSDFGSLAHKAIQALTTHWNEHGCAPNDDAVAAVADHALRDFSERPNVALFWRTRLLRALNFVNDHEATRRKTATEVVSEKEISASLALDNSLSITLQGRIDRLEKTPEGAIIADYKTGDAPSVKNMVDGKAVQLLAYAMMLQATGEEIAATSYWELPHGKSEGDIRQAQFSQLLDQDLPEKLKAALSDMLNDKTPFLARPLATADRFENDYDGISRYDEWAG